MYSKDFTYHNINEFAKRSFYSKQNDLSDFKNTLQIFYYDTKEIEPNNEDQEKDLQKRKVLINTVSKLYNKLLNIYATQYYIFSEDWKKRVKVLNKPEMLILDFDDDEYEDDLPSVPPLEYDEEVKLEPQETAAERIKRNPWKRKKTRTGLKILTPKKL